MSKEPESAKPNLRRFSLFSQPLGKSLAGVVKPVYKKHGFAEHRLLTEWDKIVGAELSAYSQPQKLTGSRARKEGGTLHVLIAAGRALEMQHLQPLILGKIATYFGYPAVSRLAFTQTHGTHFMKKPKPPAVKPPVKDEAFAALAEDCPDEDMRRALKSLAQALAAVEN